MIIQTILAVSLMFPLIPFIIFFIVFALLFRKGKRALHWSADLTTVVLFISNYLVLALWTKEYSLLILGTSYLMIALFYAINEYRKESDFLWRPLFRKLWRIYFLYGVALYFILVVGTLLIRAIQYAL